MLIKLISFITKYKAIVKWLHNKNNFDVDFKQNQKENTTKKKKIEGKRTEFRS